MRRPTLFTLLVMLAAGSPAVAQDRATPPEDWAWQRLPLRHVDVARLAPSFGWPLVPGQAYVESVASGRFDSIGEPPAAPPTLAPANQPPDPLRQAAAKLLGSAFPPGVMVLGVVDDNSLLMRGTPADLQEVRHLIARFDVASPQLRLRITAGRLAAEARGLSASNLSLADRTGSQRMEIAVSPQVRGDGTVELLARGTLTFGGQSFRLPTRFRVAAGRPEEIISFGSGVRRIAVRVTAFVEPAGR